MQVNIKQLLLEGKVLDHMKRNWGKYTTGAVGAGLGGIYAAGKGALGVDAQDAVQDWAGEAAGDLENAARYNNTQASLDAAKETFSRPDNLLTNWDKNSDTYDFQRSIQKEGYLANAQNGLARGIRHLTSMDGQPDTSNFVVRNPVTSAGLQVDKGLAYIKPVVGQ